MKSLVQALPLLLVGGVAVHSACSDDNGLDDTTSVNVTSAPIEPDACNDGRPDGYCNALGALKESCECFDCVETAYCLGRCVDDEECTADEDDCTCADCYDAECQGEEPQVTTNRPPDDDTVSSAGGGGASPTTNTGGAPGTGGDPGTGGAPGTGGTGGI